MKVTGLGLYIFLVNNFYFCLTNIVETQKREDRKSKGVTTFASAKWETTPLVLELAEYLSAESSDLFWTFFDGVNSLKSSLDTLGKYTVSSLLRYIIINRCD